MIHEQEESTLKTKDMSLFLLKNAFGAKMRKGFRNFCNGDSSISTLDLRHKVNLDDAAGSSSRLLVNSPESHPTLEEMILRLEKEKLGTRREEHLTGVQPHRRSCANSSDILRTARKALDQYPRFSLDGKDAMYRSSFTNLVGAEKIPETGRNPRRPAIVGGECVMWCKPGVVAKLMGLEAIPIPLNFNTKRERLSAIIKKQNLIRKTAERYEIERKRRLMAVDAGKRRGTVASCSRTGHYSIKPLQDFDFSNDG